MEMGTYLVLSTAHIRCATAEILNRWADLPVGKQPLLIAPTHYGWFLGTARARPDALRHLPKELPGILALGGAYGCHYVLLDCDGPVEEALPTFPW